MSRHSSTSNERSEDGAARQFSGGSRWLLVCVHVRDVVTASAQAGAGSGADADVECAAGLDRVAGFGPLQRYLDDPEIEEIWVNV